MTGPSASRARLAFAFALVATAVPVVACGGSDPAPNTPNNVGPGPQPTGTWGSGPAPTTGPAATLPPSGPTPPPTTGIPPLGPPPSSGGGTAQALDPAAAQVATAALALVANTEAPGMTKDGATIAGMFQEGQSLEAPFTFQPGKCYTLVGAGAGPQAVELEMMYTTPLPGFAPSIGTSGGAGPQASIGGKGNCMKPVSPFPAQAKFVLRAKKGAGLAAAQLYVK